MGVDKYGKKRDLEKMTKEIENKDLIIGRQYKVLRKEFQKFQTQEPSEITIEDQKREFSDLFESETLD